VKTIVQYLVISSLLLASVWILFGLEVNNRSIYSHFRKFGQEPSASLIQQFRRELDLNARPEPVKSKIQRVKRREKAPSRPVFVQDQRVAKLKAAARKAKAQRNARQDTKRSAQLSARLAKSQAPPVRPRVTRIDDRILAKDEKALDALLTARLDRLK
jgi:hypothetical protein